MFQRDPTFLFASAVAVTLFSVYAKLNNGTFQMERPWIPTWSTYNEPFLQLPVQKKKLEDMEFILDEVFERRWVLAVCITSTKIPVSISLSFHSQLSWMYAIQIA